MSIDFRSYFVRIFLWASFIYRVVIHFVVALKEKESKATATCQKRPHAIFAFAVRDITYVVVEKLNHLALDRVKQISYQMTTIQDRIKQNSGL